jgi:hypothetical protein
MLHAEIGPNHVLPSVARPTLLSEQTAGSLVANIAFVYRHYLGVLFACEVMPMMPLMLLIVVTKDMPLRWSLPPVCLYLATSSIAAAAVTIMLSDICLGNRPSVRRSYSRLLGGNRWWHTLSVVVIYSMACWLGLLLFLIPGVWLLVRGIFSVIIVPLEGRGCFKAMRRSFALTKGQALRISGLITLAYAVAILADLALTFVTRTLIATVQFNWVIAPCFEVIISGLVTPVTTLTIVLLYYDQRVRRESYDAQALTEDLMR